MKVKRKNINLLRRVLPYFIKYRVTLFKDLSCATLTTICELVLPLIVRYITSQAEENIAALSVSTILLLGAAYLVLRVIDTAASYYMQSVGHIMGTQIETDMRRDLFAHLQRLPYSYYDNTKIGQIMSRITSDLFDVTEFAHHGPEELFITTIKIVVSFAVLSSFNIYLTLIIFSILPVMLFFSYKFNRRMKKAFKESRVQVGEINSQVEDSLLGVRVVKSFANEDVEKGKFEKGNNKFLKIKRTMYHCMASFHSTTRLFDGIMYIAVVVAGAFFLRGGMITAGDFMAYLLYVTTLLTSIRRIVEFMEQFQRGMTGIERFAEVMDTPVDIEDAPDAVELTEVNGDIEFADVTFGYETEKGNVLNHVNLTIPNGANVALVGPSGGGKTTLCSLIPRFYEVTSGSILIDGKDIRTYTQNSLRRQIGVVQQDVYMFSGTVAENILYGRPDATREEVEEAAALAGAHEFISSLPNGYDTYVGERGVKLSGGQKQRLSIARVFLKNPPILILDEATSALDNESERLVQKSLEDLTKGRTTLTIAHRLSTIRKADTILVLTEDGIAEQGNHDELMAQKGIYYDLLRLTMEE
ncbi:MAG: ABC transporter ATP-binding protein [Clostridia bacterium]|nr:ABC transporter ATP-binding protein [Clostridia bacterium]